MDSALRRIRIAVSTGRLRGYDWASTEADCLPYELGAALTALKEEGRSRTESEIARCVIDYLCSLSDHAVQSLTMRLHGPSTGALVRKLL